MCVVGTNSINERDRETEENACEKEGMYTFYL